LLFLKGRDKTHQLGQAQEEALLRAASRPQVIKETLLAGAIRRRKKSTPARPSARARFQQQQSLSRQRRPQLVPLEDQRNPSFLRFLKRKRKRNTS